jgi:benzoate membrane transport protein
VSGLFKKLISYIPLSIASAMLAGILLQFGIGIFSAMNNMPVLVILMFATYVAMKYYLPRYTILAVLVVGTLFCLQTDALTLSQIDWSFATPQWVTPEFSLASIIGIGIPLFIVTMASQNLPGVSILKSSGYSQQNVSPIITTTGLSTLAFAPFGGFTFNLAAITAAICTSEEAHIDPGRRYIAGVSAGVFNIIAGLFGAAVVSLFAAFPHSMVAALAGLALLSTIANSLKAALQADSEREAALVTFLLSASSLSFFGIGSAFWGVVVGMLVLRSSKI